MVTLNLACKKIHGTCTSDGVHVPLVWFMYPVRVTTGDSGFSFDVCGTSFKHLFVASAQAVWASLSFRWCKSIGRFSEAGLLE